MTPRKDRLSINRSLILSKLLDTYECKQYWAIRKNTLQLSQPEIVIRNKIEDMLILGPAFSLLEITSLMPIEISFTDKFSLKISKQGNQYVISYYSNNKIPEETLFKAEDELLIESMAKALINIKVNKFGEVFNSFEIENEEEYKNLENIDGIHITLYSRYPLIFLESLPTTLAGAILWENINGAEKFSYESTNELQRQLEEITNAKQLDGDVYIIKEFASNYIELDLNKAIEYIKEIEGTFNSPFYIISPNQKWIIEIDNKDNILFIKLK